MVVDVEFPRIPYAGSPVSEKHETGNLLSEKKPGRELTFRGHGSSPTLLAWPSSSNSRYRRSPQAPLRAAPPLQFRTRPRLLPWSLRGWATGHLLSGMPSPRSRPALKGSPPFPRGLSARSAPPSFLGNCTSVTAFL